MDAVEEKVAVIPLESMGRKEYYAAVLPEGVAPNCRWNLWIFCRERGVGYLQKSCRHREDPELATERIMNWDRAGKLDEVKEMLGALPRQHELWTSGFRAE